MNPTLSIWLRRVLFFQLVLWSYPIVFIVRALWGEKLEWQNGIPVVWLKPDSWPRRTWYKQWGGTCFGHGIMLSETATPNTVAHEFAHVEQIEASALAGLIFGVLLSIVTLNAWPFVVLYLGLPYGAYLCASLTALVRGEGSPYMGNHFEESARAIATGHGCKAP